MRHLDARVGHERAQARRRLLDRQHAVVEVVDLSAARELARDGGAHGLVRVAHDLRLHRHALARRRAQERKIARARHGEVERARNRRGAHRQDVRRGAQALEVFLVAHAEALLLVDDDEAEVVELHLRGQDGVRADHDVGGAGEQARTRAFLLFGALETAHRLNAHGRVGEAREEGLVVLFRKHRRGREQRGLASVHRGDERGAHRHLGLAVARVAAHEAVHRLRLRHVVLHVLDRVRLVVGLLIGERRLELGDARRRDIVRKARHHGAARLRLEERRREVLHRALRVRLVLRPAPSVEPVQFHLLALHAHVSRKQMRVRHGHVQLAAIRILDREHLAARAADLDLRGPEEPPDAVVHVHHVLARLDVERLGKTLPHARRHLRARRAPPVREHAVAPRHDDESRHLEPTAELAVLHHERAPLLRRREMRRETRPRRLQQFGAARRLRAELREARQRRALERPLRHARRRGHPREDLTEIHVSEKRMGKPRVGVVVHPEDRRAGGQDVEETRLLAAWHGDGRQLRRRHVLHGGL